MVGEIFQKRINRYESLFSCMVNASVSYIEVK